MSKTTTAAADFVALFEQYGPHEVARRLKTDIRAVFRRRERIEKKLGRKINAPHPLTQPSARTLYPHRLEEVIQDGLVLIGNDAHYWPENTTPAHRAFVKFARELKPRVLVLNGDVSDGARISRHPPIGWEKRPALVEELEACKAKTAEIADAAGHARLVWTLGNHDARFETRLATVAPEYARIHGMHLRDHFPQWEPCWSLHINPGEDSWTEIKHRWKGGAHHTYTNARDSAVNYVTGHTHALRVTPYTNRRGTVFGVDGGTLADKEGPQFVDYTEDAPKDWRSGFAVLTYHKGRLLWPELVHVISDTEVEFRGKVYRV